MKGGTRHARGSRSFKRPSSRKDKRISRWPQEVLYCASCLSRALLLGQVAFREVLYCRRGPRLPAPGAGAGSAPAPCGAGAQSARATCGAGAQSALAPCAAGARSALATCGAGAHSALATCGAGAHSAPAPRGASDTSPIDFFSDLAIAPVRQRQIPKRACSYYPRYGPAVFGCFRAPTNENF
jgi:hypothetical protein